MAASALLGSLGLLLAACGSTKNEPGRSAEPALDYPITRQDATVVDDYHGTQVADPYRWLEDQDGTETAAWVAAQNKVTESWLQDAPGREAIKQRLTTLWDYPKFGLPTKAGERWVWRKNDGLQNQAVLYIADGYSDEGRVLLDPNSMSDDGTVALGRVSFSKDGRRMVYGTQASGSDWVTWSVRDVQTGEDLPDKIEWSKFSGASWTHDGKGFFYQGYPAPDQGETHQAITEAPKLHYHALGSDSATDRVIYERPDHKDWGFNARVTEDGRFAIVSISTGTDRRNRIATIDLTDATMAVEPLRMEFDASYSFVGNVDDLFFFQTDKDAPRGKVVAFRRGTPAEEHWITVVPETENSLQGVSMVGGQLITTYLADASSVVIVKNLEGKDARTLELPGIGSVGGFTGRMDDTDSFFSFSSFVTPPTVYRYDTRTRMVHEFRKPDIDFQFDDYETTRVHPQSADGTRLTLFLTHRKGLRLDGTHPTYLYAYGGFNISITPRFSVSNLAWLERGGIYAQAVLRGGSEYGEEWHQGGMREKKQNVFDDFIACAEWLSRNDYSSPAKLGIGGGSNGGLLVGAVMTQRPELFGAAVPAVGVMDMLRYHKFTIGWAWEPEYGDSENPEMFPVLHGYSPLHNLRPGTAYPATMVMTGDHDDRVLPGHSYKFAATLQQTQAGTEPTLIRIATKAGHGAGKPTSKRIEEEADRWAFLSRVLR